MADLLAQGDASLLRLWCQARRWPVETPEQSALRPLVRNALIRLSETWPAYTLAHRGLWSPGDQQLRRAGDLGTLPAVQRDGAWLEERPGPLDTVLLCTAHLA